MTRVQASRRIRADVGTVWDALADIESHVEWMADARAIRFTSPATHGLGTTFECDTKVGPIALTDHMEITEWTPERAMAVRHSGVVTGEGRFTLRPHRRGTELEWDETLRFPWWIPSRPAAVVLRVIWRGNLRRFERTLGAGSRSGPTAGRGARRRGPRRRRAR